MFESIEHPVAELEERPQETVPQEGVAQEAVPVESPAAVAPEEASLNGEGSSQHAEAGRKGAQRLHHLIRLGKLYEQEHGLKRGRQRLRQLAEEGRLYEQEHGLAPKRVRKRGPRLSSEQLLRRLLDVLVRIAKPSHRSHLLDLIRALEGETK